MRIVTKTRLKAFYIQDCYADSETPLLYWHDLVKRASWHSPSDVKVDFRNASILKAGRVVFNIAGNKYRLVVKINYSYGAVYIRFVGTHSEYDSIDANII
jgi:mRNA interferase HigB